MGNAINLPIKILQMDNMTSSKQICYWKRRLKHPLTILKVSFADIAKKDIGEIGIREKIMKLLTQNKTAKQQAGL